MPFAPASLRSASRLSVLLGCALVATSLSAPLAAHAAASSGAASAAGKASNATAARQGKVTDVREVQVKGQGSGVGVVAGAVVGGLLGNQIGKGSGNTIATVGGAVAGGFAGNEVEKNVKKSTRFKTTVQFEDGSVHDYTLGQRYALGARVEVNGKKVTLAP